MSKSITQDMAYRQSLMKYKTADFFQRIFSDAVIRGRGIQDNRHAFCRGFLRDHRGTVELILEHDQVSGTEGRPGSRPCPVQTGACFPR